MSDASGIDAAAQALLDRAPKTLGGLMGFATFMAEAAIRAFLETQPVTWYCDDAAEDGDSQCFYEADRDERRIVHGGHRECGVRYLVAPLAVSDGGEDRP